MRELSISHKLHPARQQGKSLSGLALIKYCMASNRRLVIGTNDVDALYDRIKELYPEANLSKGKHCVVVEREE